MNFFIPLLAGIILFPVKNKDGPSETKGCDYPVTPVSNTHHAIEFLNTTEAYSSLSKKNEYVFVSVGVL